MKKAVFIIFTLIGILVLCVLFAETALRLFWDGKQKAKGSERINYFYPDSTPEIGFVLKPNFRFPQKGIKVFSNKYGFRIPRNVKFEKKKGLLRVALLGDSIIFGYKTNENFTVSSIIDHELKKYKIPGVNETQALNFGVPGYNMTQYLAVLKKYGLKYKPDVVVVGVAIINDFEGFFMTYLKNGLIHPIPVYDSKGYNYELKAPSKFLWNSYLFRLLYYKFATRWENLIKGPPNPPAEDRRFRKRLPASCNRNDEIWKDIEKILDEFKAISKKYKTEIVFLLFPTAEQIYYHNTKVHIPRSTQNIIIQLLEKRDLPYIDLFDIFYSVYRSSKQLPFCDIDSHPDNLGYKLTACLTTLWIFERKHLELSDSFSGTLNMAETGASAFLSYGWTGIRQGKIKYRLVEGGEARIVFDKFRDSIKSIELRARNVEGCPSQEIKLYLNKQFLKSLSINTANEFSVYKIDLDDPIRLKDLNYLDLSFSCAAPPNALKSYKVHGPRCYSVAVSSINIR